MSYSVVYRRVARKEFDNAVDYYEGQQTGLGDRFADAVNATVRRIGRNPLMHSIVHKDIRKAVVFKFPFVIYYRLVRNQVIVTAVFHSKRNPRIWQQRT